MLVNAIAIAIFIVSKWIDYLISAGGCSWQGPACVQAGFKDKRLEPLLSKA